MRALVLYALFGVASSATDHGLRFGDPHFWRDFLAWPVVALDRVVDLGFLLTPRGQDWVTLGFAVALVLYGLAAFPLRFGRDPADPRGRRRRQVV